MKKNQRVIFSIISILFASNAFADLKYFYYNRYLNQIEELQQQLLFFQGPRSLPNDEIQSGEFDQVINPEAPPKDQKIFKQRYFINSSEAQGPDSPVLFVMCGEATCSKRDLGGIVSYYAQKYKAHRITLEHRYYGKSQPFPTLSVENLKYLKTDYALNDLARFQQYAIEKLGFKGKWTAIGGSYAGSLSAYYRLKYPHLVIGALASSAPVHAKADFEEYDFSVEKAAGPQCAAAMRAVTKQIEATLNAPAQLLKMKQLFDAQEVRDSVDFLYVVADMAAFAIQYGFRDEFCKEVLQGDPLAGYASVGKKIFSMFEITAVDDSSQGAESLNPDDYLKTVGARQWLYQSCTEYGYWQIAYHDPTISVRSSLINLNYHNELCRRLFGIQTPVNTDHINQHFYQALLDPTTTSDILFTNGSTDPWSKLSISQELGNNTNSKTATYTIQGAAHCDDLRSQKGNDSASLQGARQTFTELLNHWLR